MAFFLQLLGVIFLTIVLGIIALVLFLRFKIRGMLRQFEGFAQSVQRTMTPPRITLQTLASAGWEDAEEVEQFSGLLPNLGFQSISHYNIEELDDFVLQAWLNPKEQAYAVVYEHPQAGIWVDFVTRFEDGTGFTYSSQPQGEGIRHRPGVIVERFPDLSLEALYRKFLADRPKDRAVKKPSRDGFVSEFERAYADDMDWRNTQGGTSLEELRAIGESSGETYDEETLRLTREAAEREAIEGLEVMLRERFVNETELSVKDWERVRDRLIFVHDRLTPEALSDLVCDWTDEEPTFEPGNAPLREFFEAYNQRLPGDLRFRKIAEMTDPFPTDVYEAPQP